jgi:hypothetical protein
MNPPPVTFHARPLAASPLSSGLAATSDDEFEAQLGA